MSMEQKVVETGYIDIYKLVAGDILQHKGTKETVAFVELNNLSLMITLVKLVPQSAEHIQRFNLPAEDVILGYVKADLNSPAPEQFPMTPEENYREFVHGLFKVFPDSPIQTLLHSAVGMAGEAGELLDAIKKNWIYNKDLDVKNIKEELGDLLFYFQAMLIEFNWDFNDIMQANIEKLNKRYKNGYSDKAAQERADKSV